MKMKRQRGAVPAAHPLWVRVLALACLLVVSAASTAQAAHRHGRWLPEKAAQMGVPADAAQTPGGEEHCPLCVAMHAALPASEAMGPAQMVRVEALVSSAAAALPKTFWHYDLFSRPPPVRNS